MARQLFFDLGDDFKDSQQDTTYTKRKSIIQYDIDLDSPPPPLIFELCDKSKYLAFVSRINACELPKEIKQFLLIAATRHIVFDFEKIADYYARASKEVQELFEEQALVIIDYDNAYEQGYVELSQEMAGISDEDYINSNEE